MLIDGKNVSVALRTVGIIATDMAATLRFYRMLGLAIPAAADSEPNVDFTTPEGLVLGFLSEALARTADPTFVTPVGQAMNLQFECGSPAEVDALHKQLTDAGYTSHADPWNAFWGQRFARVVDPDGRIVNFYATLDA